MVPTSRGSLFDTGNLDDSDDDSDDDSYDPEYSHASSGSASTVSYCNSQQSLDSIIEAPSSVTLSMW